MDAHISRKTTRHRHQRLTRLITSLFLFGFSWSISGQDARVTLTWQPSPSTNVSGYTLRYGTSHNYDSVLFAGNNTTATITNLEPGSLYFFAVTVTACPDTGATGVCST